MDAALLDALSPLARLALAWCPAHAKADWQVFLALNARLEAVVRQAREPVLAQIRMAWWRDQLGEDVARRPASEPLLASLDGWSDAGTVLTPLVDAWEALLGDVPPGPVQARAFVTGRAQALGSLAGRIGADRETAGALAHRWSLAELALILGSVHGEWALAELALTPRISVVRPELCPLLVLERVTVRAALRHDPTALTSPVALAIALRAGLLRR